MYKTQYRRFELQDTEVQDFDFDFLCGLDGETINSYETVMRKPLEDEHLEDKKGDRITLRWILDSL